jgi:metal-responsive CopG/Arc/MetJ family transcriptional regulator
MPKKKVAVALSDWLLAEVDEYAAQAELSRSALVEEAAAEYLSRRRHEAQDERYQREAAAALEDMAAFAEERAADSSGEGEPTSLEILRGLRSEGIGSDS